MEMGRLRALSIVFVLVFVFAGCSKRQMTQGDSVKTGGDQVKKVTPTLSIDAEPREISHGECVDLKWSVENADNASISPDVGKVDMSGTRKTCPPFTTVYTITASGGGGSATASVKVTVSPPPPVPTAKEKAPVFDNIYFDFDKSDIRSDARPTLEKIASYLSGHEKASILIEGHTDERGTNEYNFALGDRRAHSAKNYLINLGIDAKRIKTISYGEEKPEEPGHDESAWSKNRRDVFSIQ